MARPWRSPAPVGRGSSNRMRCSPRWNAGSAPAGTRRPHLHPRFGLGDRTAAHERIRPRGHDQRVIRRPLDLVAADDGTGGTERDRGVRLAVRRDQPAAAGDRCAPARPVHPDRAGHLRRPPPRRRPGNAAARELLVAQVEIDGQRYLHYRPMRVDIALIRGTAVDPLGDIGVRRGTGRARRARRRAGRPRVRRCGPGTGQAGRVDAVAAARGDRAGRAGRRGRGRTWTVADLRRGVRPDVVWRRAERAVRTGPGRPDPRGDRPPGGAGGARRRGSNVGFGVAAQVVDALVEQGRLGEVTLAIEQGLFNGIPESGDLFGVAHGPTARMASTTQFELFAMGLLDACCLGMASSTRPVRSTLAGSAPNWSGRVVSSTSPSTPARPSSAARSPPRDWTWRSPATGCGSPGKAAWASSCPRSRRSPTPAARAGRRAGGGLRHRAGGVPAHAGRRGADRGCRRRLDRPRHPAEDGVRTDAIRDVRPMPPEVFRRVPSLREV